MWNDEKQAAFAKHSWFIALVVALLVSGLFFLPRYMRSQNESRIFTLTDLPKDARLIHHSEEELEAEKLGKIAMDHYATPEAEHRGGPTYGAYGYQIVAVEYEMPISSIGKRIVGSSDPGQLLSLPTLTTLEKLTPYDHFHIGISQHIAADENHHNGGSTNKNDTYLIVHLMLIPHEIEEAIGLYCG